MWRSTSFSQKCNAKTTTSLEITKPPPKCANCGSGHSYKYKDCLQFPIEPQFRKSYAKIIANPKNLRSEFKFIKKHDSKFLKLTQLPPNQILAKGRPPTHHLYELYEFPGYNPAKAEIILKMKEKLNLSYFQDIPHNSNSVLDDIKVKVIQY